jgi:hypothetical protein
MAEQTPEGVPASLTAGNTWTWYQTLTDYAPSESGGTWTLSYAVAGVGVLKWDPDWVTDDGSRWTVTVPATATAGLAAGRYEWQAIVAGGGGYASQRHTPLRGVLDVQPNPEWAGPGDRQAWAERTLAAVEAVLEGRVTADVQAYQIGSRSVTSIPMAELYTLRTKLQHEVWRLRNPGLAGPTRRLAFRPA